ncbi:hypothetical protein ACQ4M4_27410 [Leptolyngbya sp. AN02str]|uniref:hypothetical protein n=1 Tax=Leptolyngbya sp. AN02str TaxID=3423363 RepID=UPI003D31F793
MAKTKGAKGGNPKPVQTEGFKAQQFAPAPDVPKGVELADKAICVKLPIDVDAWVRSLPDKSVWLRRVICGAAKAEMQPPIAIAETSHLRFSPGDLCKLPSGSRVVVDEALDGDRYRVVWEASGASEEVPGNFLTLLSRA